MAAINGSNFLLYRSDIDPKVSEFQGRVLRDGGTLEALNCVRDAFEDQKIAIGHSSSTTINLNVDLPESTTKDSSGFREVIAGVKSGEIAVDGLVDYSDSVNFNELASHMMLKDKLEFYFEDSVSGLLVYNGEGYIESVEQIAEMENAVSYSLGIKLTGLVVVDGV